jgi:hypothetical protein
MPVREPVHRRCRMPAATRCALAASAWCERHATTFPSTSVANSRMVVGVVELVHVVKPVADPEHLLGSQDLYDLIPAFVSLEHHRTTERRVLVQQLGHPIDVPAFNGGPKAIGKHGAAPCSADSC